MKFRDKKTGEVNDTIGEAFSKFCAGRPCKTKCGYICPLNSQKIDKHSCFIWSVEHPAEAAHLMGYEVIDEKEDNMDKQDKQVILIDGKMLYDHIAAIYDTLSPELPDKHLILLAIENHMAAGRENGNE